MDDTQRVSSTVGPSLRQWACSPLSVFSDSAARAGESLCAIHDSRLERAIAAVSTVKADWEKSGKNDTIVTVSQGWRAWIAGQWFPLPVGEG